MLAKTLTAFALAAALPFAAQAGGGADQLARSVGVQPGVYSLSQMANLASYKSENSSAARAQVAFILANPQGPGARPTSRGGFTPDQSVFPQDFGTSNPNRLND